jgi:hypothetical protein
VALTEAVLVRSIEFTAGRTALIADDSGVAATASVTLARCPATPAAGTVSTAVGLRLPRLGPLLLGRSTDVSQAYVSCRACGPAAMAAAFGSADMTGPAGPEALAAVPNAMSPALAAAARPVSRSQERVNL